MTHVRFDEFTAWDPARHTSPRGKQGVCEWYFASCDEKAVWSCKEHGQDSDWMMSFCETHAARALGLDDPGKSARSVDEYLMRPRSDREAQCKVCFMLVPSDRLSANSVCGDCE